MKWTQRIFLGIALIVAMRPPIVIAQGEEDFGEESRLNTNIAFVISSPTNPTAKFSDIGWGAAAGAGFNVNKNHAFVGEFMYNRLHIKDKALVPIRLALQNPEVHGHSDLFAFTANYKLEFRGRTLGAYFIGGPGFYHRSTRISPTVLSG